VILDTGEYVPCWAMSRLLIPGKPQSYMICTRDQGHKGSHTSCDGRGHILATWLRMPVERFWTPDLEKGHQHHTGGGQ